MYYVYMCVMYIAHSGELRFNPNVVKSLQKNRKSKVTGLTLYMADVRHMYVQMYYVM